MGKCPDCDQWDSLDEITNTKQDDASHRQHSAPEKNKAPIAIPISKINTDESLSDTLRLPTGITELDRVLGGTSISDAPNPEKPPKTGIVKGSAVLIGGDPGIGKSTLLLQAADKLSTNHRVLYVTSEESEQQLTLRAQRLGVLTQNSSELFILADTNLARIIEQIKKVKPDVVVIDSIQMIYKADLPSAPGSITQLRSCALELCYLAKAIGCAIILVGHVTKEGQLAGPRLIEHMVDAVLYFEGDRYHSHRIIRAIKNRFGNTLEVGLFEMTDAGLQQVTDASRLLATQYTPQPGSIISPVLQGSRCLLVEIQALTATGFLGSAKRKTSGIDNNRLAMLIAVLEKHGELKLADQDIFTSSVGGIKIAEPAADLAIALAISTAHYNKTPQEKTCAIGEIGLGGEIRHVQQIDQRIAEAARLGFTNIICPKAKIKKPKNATLLQVQTLNQAIQLLD